MTAEGSGGASTAAEPCPRCGALAVEPVPRDHPAALVYGSSGRMVYVCGECGRAQVPGVWVWATPLSELGQRGRRP